MAKEKWSPSTKVMFEKSLNQSGFCWKETELESFHMADMTNCSKITQLREHQPTAGDETKS
jgi:hypothetical protein